MKNTDSILVVLPEVPYPPRKNGLCLRYFPLLQRLSKKLDLVLAIIVSDDLADSERDLGGLEEDVRQVIYIRKSDAVTPLARIKAQLSRVSPVGTPHLLYDYGTESLLPRMRNILAESYNAVVWVTLGHALHLCLPLLRNHRLIVDAVDSVSLHFERNTPPSKLKASRLAKLKRWEANIVDRTDKTFYISPIDLANVRQSVPNASLDISPNGILVDDYTNDKFSEGGGPCIGFLGNMSYQPNVDAVHRLYEAFKAVRRVIPTLQLCVIGRDPDPSLQAYANEDGVMLTGSVDSVWPYVNSVDLFVMPMTMGAGQQNKVLEVMYAGKPVIASSVANGGICAVDGQSIAIADDTSTLVNQITDLVADVEKRNRLATEGQTFVRETYDWGEIAECFAGAVE